VYYRTYHELVPCSQLAGPAHALPSSIKCRRSVPNHGSQTLKFRVVHCKMCDGDVAWGPGKRCARRRR